MRQLVLLPAALGTAGAILVACSDSSGPNCGTSPDISGSYELVSFQPPGFPAALPGATGSITLTATTYGVEIEGDLGQGQTTIAADTGTYSLCGNKISQVSPDPSIGTSSGTVDFTDGPGTADTLTVDVTNHNLETVSVWGRP
jgi:hypothetical protein